MAKSSLPHAMDEQLLLPRDMREWLPEGRLALVNRVQRVQRVRLGCSNETRLDGGSSGFAVRQRPTAS